MNFPDLDTCKKLEAAGFNQATKVQWLETIDGWQCSVDFEPRIHKIFCNPIAAPMLTEILEQIPKQIKDDVFVELNAAPPANSPNEPYRWQIAYVDYDEFVHSEVFEHENPVEAAAQLWLFCREKGYIK